MFWTCTEAFKCRKIGVHTSVMGYVYVDSDSKGATKGYLRKVKADKNKLNSSKGDVAKENNKTRDDTKLGESNQCPIQYLVLATGPLDNLDVTPNFQTMLTLGSVQPKSLQALYLLFLP